MSLASVICHQLPVIYGQFQFLDEDWTQPHLACPATSQVLESGNPLMKTGLAIF